MTNISHSKGNQAIKFGQLIEYNMRNIFSWKKTQNVVEKLLPDPFLKNQNWAYLWINSLKFYSVCFYCMPSWRLAYTSYKAFFKNKKSYGIRRIFRIRIRRIFAEKCFSCYTLLPDQISLRCCLYFVRYWAICVL